MDSDITIVQASKSDIDGICRIESESFPSDAFNRRQLLYLIKNSLPGCFIAVCQRQCVGYISLLHRRGTNTLRIYSIAVDSSVRNRGVGQLLINFAKSKALSLSLKEITLEVNTHNTAAIKLYEKNGFSVFHTIDNYYHDGSSAFKMHLMS